MSLKKANRLSNRFEFSLVRKNGVSVSGQGFFMYLLVPQKNPVFVRNIPTNSSPDITRIGVVVGLGFDKRAVVRNKASRYLKKSAALLLDKIPAGSWLVFYPRHALKEMTYEEVSSAVSTALQKIPVSG